MSKDKKKVASVSKKKCIVCKRCVKKCPKDAITVVDNEYAKVKKKKCVACKKCFKVCPEDAIKLKKREK